MLVRPEEWQGRVCAFRPGRECETQFRNSGPGGTACKKEAEEQAAAGVVADRLNLKIPCEILGREREGSTRNG